MSSCHSILRFVTPNSLWLSSTRSALTLAILFALLLIAARPTLIQAQGFDKPSAAPLAGSMPSSIKGTPSAMGHWLSASDYRSSFVTNHNQPSDPFLPVVSYYLPGYWGQGVAIADVNGDSKPDLLVASLCINDNCPDGGGEVSVLLGNGDGTFQNPVSYYTGGVDAQAIAVADVNGDEIPDLLVANRCVSGSDCTGNVAVLLGNGDGTFQPPATYLTGGQQAWSIVLADLRGDGKLDAVVVDGGSNSVSVLLGNGDGSFQPPLTYTSGGYSPLSAAVADVNLDGVPDIVVSNVCVSFTGTCAEEEIGEGSVEILLGNGDGTFTQGMIYDTGGNNAMSVVSGDVNRDGKPDLIIANACGDSLTCAIGAIDGTVTVLLGRGDGTFLPPAAYSTGTSDPIAVAVNDVNRDGNLDIMVSNYIDPAYMAVLLGNGNGTFQTAATFYLSGGGDVSPQSIAVGDLNGDGWPDLVTSSARTNNVNVLINNMASLTPTTGVVAATLNPVGVNQLVTYTATLSTQSGGTLTGTVVFRDGGTIIASRSLRDNQAPYQTQYTQVGSHSITADYAGDWDNNGSQASLTEYVRDETETVLVTSGTPSIKGQPVTFTATVTSKYGTIPNGEPVTFYDGEETLASVPLSGGQAAYTTSTLPVGKHTIGASYAGDNTFEASAGKVVQVVKK